MAPIVIAWLAPVALFVVAGAALFVLWITRPWEGEPDQVSEATRRRYLDEETRA